MPPFFFFGSLRDPELLELVLGRDVDPADIIPAYVEGYCPITLAEEAYPVLARSPGMRAEGVIFRGYDAADLARLEYYEDIEYGLAPIEVMTSDRPITAQFFETTGTRQPGDAIWDFADWSRQEKPLALEAADELMGHFGIVPLEASHAIWEGIKVRAQTRVRAKAEQPVMGRLRAVRDGGDVRSTRIERPYTGFFAIEEHHLVHRRFDGGWSPEIKRTALTSGDAVTVLPYDPVRDQVLLIEQFRAPMFARGDACPWGVEVIAGRVDPDDDPEGCARREALEEAGLRLGRIETIARYYTSPGVSAEYLIAFVAEADLAGAGGIHGLAGEDEDIRAFTVPLADAMAGVASGEINNAPAILSLLWLNANAARLRDAWAT